MDTRHPVNRSAVVTRRHRPGDAEAHVVAGLVREVGDITAMRGSNREPLVGEGSTPSRSRNVVRHLDDRILDVVGIPSV